MNLNASAFQNTGKQGVEQTEEKRHDGAQAHERVHVGSAFAQKTPGADVEIAAGIEHYRQNKAEHNPIAWFPMHKAHSNDHERNGKDPGYDHFGFQLLIFFLLRLGLPLLDVLVWDDKAVANGLHLRLDLGGSQFVRIIFYQ
ncbi:MAG: hypothetical protein BWX52_01807 [Bacteroidetes bacterium ADurb.Bin013]|nr:MAG: hypothetical protein BWX52_01807 [Bacteroidetes bacterium ADurb.Bin013]